MGGSPPFLKKGRLLSSKVFHFFVHEVDVVGGDACFFSMFVFFLVPVTLVLGFTVQALWIRRSLFLPPFLLILRAAEFPIPVSIFRTQFSSYSVRPLSLWFTGI